jgi:predicted dehydrogenase
MKKVGIGIIGSGSIADIAHCPSIRELDNAELVALCDTDEQILERMSKKWEPKRTYKNYQDLVKDKEIDVVIIATPNNLHHEQTIAALNEKKHCIVEKPFSCTHDEAWDMVNTAKKNGVMVMTGTNQKFWLQCEIAKQLILDGFIGEPKMGRSSLHETWGLYHEQLSYTKFRSVPDMAGAGALFDLGSHRVDLLMYLMGSTPKRVMGIVKRLATPEEYTKLDDSYWITIEFENGATGVVSGDRFSPAVSNITEIYGTEGTIFSGSEATNPFQSAPLAVFSNKDMTLDQLPDIVRKYRYPQLFWSEDIMSEYVPKRWVPIYPPREWSYMRLLKHLIDCVFEGKEPIIKMEDGAIVMDVLLGALKSMKTGSWVDIPLKEEYIPPYYNYKKK